MIQITYNINIIGINIKEQISCQLLEIIPFT